MAPKDSSTVLKYRLSMLLLAIVLGSGLALTWPAFVASGFTSDATDPVLFLDINPGSTSSSPYDFFAFQNHMYFAATQPETGYELWRTDGTPAGTTLFKDLVTGTQSAYPQYFAVMGDTLLFSALDTPDFSPILQLWQSDGTPGGTVKVPSGKMLCEYYSPCKRFIVFDNRVFYYGGDDTHGYELWQTDGTVGGAALVKDIYPGPESSILVSFTPLNGMLYFFANDGVHGNELWASDGAAGGTQMVKDILPGVNPGIDIYGSGNSQIIPIGNRLFFVATNGISGYELWVSDGTPEGTRMVKDIRPGGNGSSPRNMTAYNGELFFMADDGTHGMELWKSDGSQYGTTLVKDIRPGSPGKRSYCHPCELGPIHQGYLYFEMSSENALQLWRTDGTTRGTVPVTDLAPEFDFNGANVSNPFSLNNLLYIHRNVGGQYGLWKSDGISAPVLIANGLHPAFFGKMNPGSSDFIEGQYIFNMYEASTGDELWSIPVPSLSAFDLSLLAKNVFPPGGQVTYTLSFQNSGPVPSLGAVITSTLSGVVQSVQTVSSGAVITLTSASPRVWQVSALAPGAGGVITLTGSLPVGLAGDTLITHTVDLRAQMADGLTLSLSRGKQSVLVDIPPGITGLQDTHTLANHATTPISFTVSDEDTPVNNLTLTASSSNPALVANDAILINGSGATRTLVITPTLGLTGSAVITITVSDASNTVPFAFTLYVDPYRVHLPVVHWGPNIYIPPGNYPVQRCQQESLYIRGNYIGELTECVTSVVVQDNGDMQFNFSWMIDMIPSVDYVDKYSDAGNRNMYITDNVDNRYDHFDVGGAAAVGVRMYDNIPVEGWFLFPRAMKNAHTFVFHDADQGIGITGIHLGP